MKHIFYIVLLFCTGFIYADAGPKFKDEVQLYFYENGKMLPLNNYKLFVLEEVGNIYDTINKRRTTADYWTVTTLQEGEYNYYLNVKKSNPIIIKLLYKNNIYESNVINLNASKDVISFNVGVDRLEDISPLFYTSWAFYFAMFAITLFIEVAIGILCRKWFKLSKVQLVLLISLINIVSHPLLWYVHSHYDVNLLLLEILVVCAEALAFSRFTTIKLAFVFSFVANLLSFLIGGICSLFIDGT